MFEAHEKTVFDPISIVSAQFLADSRPEKLNLCIGYFESEITKNTGFTVLGKTRKNKSKVGFNILGEESFREAIKSLLKTQASQAYNFSVVQTIGASGGLWLIFTLFQRFTHSNRVWFSTPTWSNHLEIAKNTNLEISRYRYQLDNHGELEMDKLIQDISTIKCGDILVLQGCCHNPLGVDLDIKQWKELAKHVKHLGAHLVIDFAYFGLKNGIEKDKSIFLPLFNELEHFFVVNSFSKNMGLYGERIGALSFFSRSNKYREQFELLTKKIVRSTYSMPPQKLAQEISEVISSNDLSQLWHKEISVLRETLLKRKNSLLDVLKRYELFHIVTNPKSHGMFLNLNLTEEEINTLAKEFGIYILPNGRLSLASLQLKDINQLVEAIHIIKK
ncbi:aminotransferase class I/II-fold pyridoxal phosphate-dependent enzyme [Xenorhabdus sp. PB61.4]|uniref:aminotransferase class I/II-fold pyridoxal phosphate-dependent enzyme n=1 Tax=Xenorhabdus sp. PB61.4 TaxID=2788940 RepID=UPI001E5BDB72|nr:aminotransferase class I/II-fold pyridoxal phosphate-dependent enzyme [Xenorhabdus sp. PB61.4]MCC8368360.1 aminotransferase class I/II-fold pyridoxal phosphate-dependent enzyme [Xenorhabdus sp. PB61.4]